MEVEGSCTITGKPWLLFFFPFFAFPEITCLNWTSNSAHPSSCSVFQSLPFLIGFLSLLIVLHGEVAAVGGHQEAAPHTLHSSTLMPAFVNSCRGGFFPLLWWPLIKQKFRTDQTLKLHFRNSPRVLQSEVAKWQCVFTDNIKSSGYTD